MNPATTEIRAGMQIHAGHWFVALLVSGLLIGLGAAAFVVFSKRDPAPGVSDVVIAIRSSEQGATTQPAVKTTPADPSMLKDEAQKAQAQDAVTAPKVALRKESASKPKEKPKPKPKPKQKPKQKSEIKPKPKLQAEPRPKQKSQIKTVTPAVRQPVVQDTQPSRSPSAVPGESVGVPAAEPPLADSVRNAYLSRVVRALSDAKRYPDRAQRQGIEGVTAVRFEFDENGKVLGKAIEESSGFPVLDDAALSVIDRAAPFEPPPDGYGKPPYVFRIPISFTLR